MGRDHVKSISLLGVGHVCVNFSRALVDEPRLMRIGEAMNLASFLVNSARTYAERPALSLGTEVRYSYGELARRVSALAGALGARFGLGAGERVALVMGNCPAYIEVLFGAWHAGLAAVPINAKLHPRELSYILEHSGARLCFATSELAQSLAPVVGEVAGLEAVICVDDRDYGDLFRAESVAMRETEPGDLAWLFYTSGTTGWPKGAMLSHRNLLAMSRAYLEDVDGISERDCVVHAAPLSHGSGLYGLPHVAKGANQVMPASRRFDPAEVFDLIAAYPGTSFFFAPTMVSRLVGGAAAGSLSRANLKTLIYGGGPMYLEDLRQALDLFGPKLVQIYGQGESPMTISTLSKAHHADGAHPRHLQRLASAGLPYTGVEVRLLDDDNNEVAAGEVGEVAVRGEVVMAGYWRDDKASAETLRGGWLHTGDLGAFDEDGFLTLKDRSKDLIISGGTNIYPREIEEVLLRHEGVLECSVVGRPHPEWGEEVVAFVVPRPGWQVREGDLDALCLDNIARFKRPRAYRFLDGLPHNDYGKVLKTALRERLAAEAGRNG